MTVMFRRTLLIGVPILSLLLIAWVCIFKSGDPDFYWHVKAGQLMREIGGIIHTDPFAYTREGQPYLASHEWLAQVILSVFFDLGGPIGVLILRILLVTGSFALLLTIDPKRSWLTSILMIFAAAGIRHAIADRPQLFTFFLFTLTLVLCIQYLQIESTRRRTRLLYFFPVVILLWSNLHGAASVIGIGLIGILLLQRLTSLALSRSLWPLSPRNEVSWILGVLVLSGIALLLTPSGFGNISYLLSLTSDRTAEFILEWQPASWKIYLLRNWYLWVIAIAAVAFTRKHLTFSLLTLLFLGMMSRMAVRHEPLFVFGALGIIMHQLRYNEIVHHWMSKVLSKTILTAIGLLVLLFLACMYVDRVRYDAARQYQLYGIGLFETGKSAVEFLEEHNITGNGFNSYELGGYLLYRGHKVFLDGRNVDYGYEYLKKALDAKKDPSVFYALSQEYSFTHAIIFYGDQLGARPMPYAGHLYANPEWVLVYLDDWVAIFVRNTPEHQQIISQFGYTMLTPETLEDQQIPSELVLADFERLQSELQRVNTSHPEGVKGYLMMSRLAMMVGQYRDAEILLNKALERQPNNHRIYLNLTDLAMEMNDWKKAEKYLDTALEKMGHTHAVINEEFVLMVREKAKSQ